MKRDNAQRNSTWLLRFLMIVLLGVTVYAVDVLNTAGETYAAVSDMTASTPTTAAAVRLGDSELTIPNYDMFKAGNVWALVSKKRPLAGEAGYTLIDAPIEHGDADKPMKIAVDISDELQQLVNAAEADDEPLMISSAYRSLQAQREIYDDFVAENGETVAKQYVSPVGASEHHTGLSVDFSSQSDQCRANSDDCSLSQSGAAWLAANAHRYGFIQRYPAGEQSVTGVAFEPWHFRFVGKPLARAMQDSDLTFDEVVEQFAPGYAKPKPK